MSTTGAKLNEPNRTGISRKPTKIRRSQKQWIAIFEARRKSGLSVERFCTANHISHSAYWKWSKRLDATKSATVTKAVAPTFIPIPIRTTPTPGLELELGTMRVRFDGPATDRIIDALVNRIATQA